MFWGVNENPLQKLASEAGAVLVIAEGTFFGKEEEEEGDCVDGLGLIFVCLVLLLLSVFFDGFVLLLRLLLVVFF